MAHYIYILVNPSLRGLLKIGKTTRTPDERAAELSASSNMPTPFMVAYEEEVPDCSVAERLVHQKLAEDGYRVNDSREFFTVPLKIAIYTVSTVAEQLREVQAQGIEQPYEAFSTEDSSAEYHFLAGMDAMGGTANTLQDFSAARKHFETAIALGSIKAHYFLAHLYTLGNGVPQSADSALKILKAGGDKGDMECYKAMWDIYAGNTVLDIRHEGNAELCFQWLLEGSGNDAPSSALNDYLVHAYDNLGGEGKKPISLFPGKFATSSIEMWMSRVRTAFDQVKVARLAGIDIRTLDSEPGPTGGARGEIIDFQVFVSGYILDAGRLMRSVMANVSLADLEYCFSTARDVRSTLALYTDYLPNTPSPPEPQRLHPTVKSESPTKAPGFLKRLFSR